MIMFLGIINQKMYYGVEQYNDGVFDKLSSLDLKKYINLMNSNGHIELNENNFIELVKIYNKYLTDNNKIIIWGFDPDDSFVKNLKCVFCGYDITGESLFCSPVFRTFFENNSSLYLKNLKKVYCKYLNENGLFSNHDIAFNFLEEIQANGMEYFENDGLLKIIQIWTVSKNTNL